MDLTFAADYHRESHAESLRRFGAEEEAAALRSTVRKRVLWAATLAYGPARFDCVVVDLSLGGARIFLAQPLGKGDIAVVAVATGATVNITNSNGVDEAHPDWRR